MASSSRLVAPAVEGLSGLRAAVRQALATVRPGRDARAFAFDGATCVVTWRPSGSASRAHDVHLRLRDGSRTREHALVLSDLGMLAPTCEHHVRTFLARRDLDDPASGPGRLPGAALGRAGAAARLRARLAGIASPVDLDE